MHAFRHGVERKGRTDVFYEQAWWHHICAWNKHMVTKRWSREGRQTLQLANNIMRSTRCFKGMTVHFVLLAGFFTIDNDMEFSHDHAVVDVRGLCMYFYLAGLAVCVYE